MPGLQPHMDTAPSRSHTQNANSTQRKRRYNHIYVDCPHCHSPSALRVRQDRDHLHPETRRPVAVDARCEVCFAEDTYAPPATLPTTTMDHLTDDDLDEQAESVDLESLSLAPLPEALRETMQSVYPMNRGLGWWLFSDGRSRRVTEEQALDIEAALRDPARRDKVPAHMDTLTAADDTTTTEDE